MAYTKYSLTPANNNAAPPDGAPEGMLPSAVNDTMRDMMAQIRDVGDGVRNGTYTMTAPVITGGSITGVALSGNTLTNPVITGGSINNTTVGATTRSTGAFTTLASNGATTFTAGTASTSTTTGTAVITGGLGVSGRINAANFDGIVGANTAAAGNFTTLGATGVATFSAGTVSAPAITTTGDTNTGIFFPAADTIAFTEGGVEAMRIDSNSLVLIGTTTNSTNAKLQVGSGAFTVNPSTNIFGTLGGDVAGSASPTTYFGISYDTTNNIANFEALSGGVAWRNIGLATRGGSVGINTSVPNATLHLGAGGASLRIGISASNQYGELYRDGPTGNIVLNAAQASFGNLVFQTASTERMRINSSGLISMGTTAAVARLTVQNISSADSTTIDLRGNRNYTAETFGATSLIAVSDQNRASHDFGAIRFEQNPATSDGGGALVRMFAGGASSTFAANTEFLRATAITLANGTDNIQFRTAGTERMRITSAGVVELAQGQIKFPATQVASADANTLDDYEEGTWTPTLVGAGGSIGSQAYTIQAGRYVKIGRFVVLTGYLTLSNKGSWTGQIKIGGFPFSVDNNQANYSSHGFYAINMTLPSLSYGVGAFTFIGTTTAEMWTNNSTGIGVLADYANQVNNNSQIGPFQFCYYANA
jgi:hypothetical protein